MLDTLMLECDLTLNLCLRTWLTIKESIYIRVNNPTLNQNIGKYNLSHEGLNWALPNSQVHKHNYRVKSHSNINVSNIHAHKHSLGLMLIYLIIIVLQQP